MVVPSGKEHRNTPFEGYDKSVKVRGTLKYRIDGAVYERDPIRGKRVVA